MIVMTITLYILHADVHTVAALKTTESYGAIKDGFRDTIASINALAKRGAVTLNGTTNTVEVVCCADYKVKFYF